FPSVRNGLGRVENRGLELIHAGATRFDKLFPAFIDAEPIYGLGDAQFWLALTRMSNTVQPLIEIKNAQNENQTPDAEEMKSAEFEITALGRAVLRGDADFVVLNGIDLWLGGVYLSGDKNIWRWDQERNEVVLV